MDSKKTGRGQSSNWLKAATFFILSLVVLYFTFAAGFLYGQKGRPLIGIGSKNVINTEVEKPDNVDFSLYWDAWNRLQESSVVRPDVQKMLYGSISGMLSSLSDPYTVFFTPEDAKRFREDIQGSFDGIGVEIIQKNGFPTVVAPLSETPAEMAGIKAGDIIIEVDGNKTSEMGFNEVVDKIRGQKGTKVTLKLAREGKDEPFNIDVIRETIVVKSVEWETKEAESYKYSYVKIRQFGDDTDNLFSDFAEEVVRQKPDGIIVDLRNNPGGLLQSAVNLSSYFLDGGTVVSEKDRDNHSQEFKVTKKAILGNYKTVVLVNKGSASASEIFSGALQDRKIGKLIGEKTFGKGSVQEIMELKDGSAVKITVAKWYTPNGRSINGDGITPDIVLANNDDNKTDLQLERAIQFLSSGT